MTELTPSSSRKRPSPAEEVTSNGSSTCDSGSIKRQRTTPPSTVASSSLLLSTSGKDASPTPPVSAKRTPTMALKLVIPQKNVSSAQQKTINRHLSDAERWKPKLQRPFPKHAEIKKAYSGKLMRHYSNASAQVDPDFLKPKIDKSPRVSRLLEQFPLMDTTQPVRTTVARRPTSPITPVDRAISLSARVQEMLEAREAQVELQTNIHITGSEHAQRLAWQAFSRTERDRVDRGREVMMESGLPIDDLMREAVGQCNRLPEWKKPKTGRFAREQRTAS